MKRTDYNISLDVLDEMGNNSAVFDAVTAAMKRFEAGDNGNAGRYSTPAGGIEIKAAPEPGGLPVITFCKK